MDLLALRHALQAQMFLIQCQLNELRLDEWRQLIAEIPEDVEKAIVAWMSAVGGAFAGIHD